MTLFHFSVDIGAKLERRKSQTLSAPSRELVFDVGEGGTKVCLFTNNKIRFLLVFTVQRLKGSGTIDSTEPVLVGLWDIFDALDLVLHLVLVCCC